MAKPGLECATLDVPLDYRRPGGRAIEIAVSRLASTDPRKRRGVLLTNTGGPGGANITPCAFWPSEPVEPQVQITDEGPSNVLVLHNLRDPATPLAGARQLRDAFGDRARMVTADRGGHLAYLFLDNRCVHDIVTDFLVAGERPHRDLACGG